MRCVVGIILRDSTLIEMGSVIHERIKSMVLTQIDFMKYVDKNKQKIDKELLFHIQEINSQQTNLLNTLILGGERVDG